MPPTQYTYSALAALFDKSWLALEVDGKELSGAGYARQSVRWTSGAEGFALTNAAGITFPKAQADWGKVTGLCVCDAQSGGNELWALEPKRPKLVYSGDRVTFDAGSIELEIK